MRLILYLLLFVAISSFADSTKKILPLEIGGILKLSDIDKEEANLEYQIAKQKKEISLNTFEMYGIHSAYALTRFFYAYGDLYYQYFQVSAKENTQHKQKQRVSSIIVVVTRKYKSSKWHKTRIRMVVYI